MMEMITDVKPTAVVWIASYPKSGNTWVQSVIREAGKDCGFPQKDLDVYRLMQDNAKPVAVSGVRKKISEEPATVLKTHSRCSPNMAIHPQLKLKTVGFVYVKRNPLDMLLSYINFTRLQYERRINDDIYKHALFVDLMGFDKPLPYDEWLGMSIDHIPREHLDHALKRFTELGAVVPGLKMAGGSWLEHCISWDEAAAKVPSVILKYEDLLTANDNFYPIKKLFRFTDEQIELAVARVNSKQRGERSNKIFFNKMDSLYYVNYFSGSVIRQFLDRFSPELVRLGYADLPGGN